MTIQTDKRAARHKTVRKPSVRAMTDGAAHSGCRSRVGFATLGQAASLQAASTSIGTG